MAETLQERKPSYAVVRRIVRSLPAGLLMLAHGDNKAYSEGFDLVHRREALRPNSIWQVDHVQLDIKLLRDDGFSAVGTRLGVSSIVRIEITGPTIPAPQADVL